MLREERDEETWDGLPALLYPLLLRVRERGKLRACRVVLVSSELVCVLVTGFMSSNNILLGEDLEVYWGVCGAGAIELSC